MEQNVGTKRKRDPLDQEYHDRRKRMANYDELKANDEKTRNVRNWVTAYKDRSAIKRFGESEEVKRKTTEKAQVAYDEHEKNGGFKEDRPLYKKLEKRQMAERQQRAKWGQKLQKSREQKDQMGEYAYNEYFQRSTRKIAKLDDKMDEALFQMQARKDFKTNFHVARKKEKKAKDASFPILEKLDKTAVKDDYRAHFPQNNRYDARDFVNRRLEETPNPQTIQGVNRHQENLARARKGQPKIKKESNNNH